MQPATLVGHYRYHKGLLVCSWPYLPSSDTAASPRALGTKILLPAPSHPETGEASSQNPDHDRDSRETSTYGALSHAKARKRTELQLKAKSCICSCLLALVTSTASSGCGQPGRGGNTSHLYHFYAQFYTTRRRERWQE